VHRAHPAYLLRPLSAQQCAVGPLRRSGALLHTAQHIIGAHVPVCETLAVGASKWRDFDRDFPAPESYAALKLQVKLLRTNLDSGSYPRTMAASREIGVLSVVWTARWPDLTGCNTCLRVRGEMMA
jgi:hypothetical protein